MGGGSSSSYNANKASSLPKDLKLYLWRGSAPCRAVLMVAKAANIPMEMMPVDLLKGGTQTPEYLKMNPQHTVPTLVDGKYVLWESRAILQYLMNKYGSAVQNLYPRDPQQRAEVDRMLNYDLSSLYHSIGDWFYPQVFANAEATEEKIAAVKKSLAYLDTVLENQKFMSGKAPTIADISMVTGIPFLGFKGIDIGEFKNVSAWYQRMQEQPYYDAANKDGLGDWRGMLKL